MQCENCGEPIKEFTCQWCEEELYICEEFSDVDVNYSEEFLLTAEEQKNSIRKALPEMETTKRERRNIKNENI